MGSQRHAHNFAGGTKLDYERSVKRQIDRPRPMHRAPALRRMLLLQRGSQCNARRDRWTSLAHPPLRTAAEISNRDWNICASSACGRRRRSAAPTLGSPTPRLQRASVQTIVEPLAQNLRGGGGSEQGFVGLREGRDLGDAAPEDRWRRRRTKTSVIIDRAHLRHLRGEA